MPPRRVYHRPPVDIGISIGADLVPWAGAVADNAAQIVLRVNEYDREMINRAAQTLAMSSGDFMRCAVRESARGVLIIVHGTDEIDWAKDYTLPVVSASEKRWNRK